MNCLSLLSWLLWLSLFSSLSVGWPSGYSWDKDSNFCDQITIFPPQMHIKLYLIIWSSYWVEVKWAHVRLTYLFFFTSPSGWIRNVWCGLQLQLSVILVLHKRLTLMPKSGGIEHLGWGGTPNFVRSITRGPLCESSVRTNPLAKRAVSLRKIIDYIVNNVLTTMSQEIKYYFEN